MKIIKRITFLLFILSVIVFLDLAHNYFNATFTELHDGIMLTGFFSKIIYGDNSWSLFRFYNGFITSLRIVSFLGILNIFPVKDYEERYQYQSAGDILYNLARV